jgi:hypothetical protein
MVSHRKRGVGPLVRAACVGIGCGLLSCSNSQSVEAVRVLVGPVAENDAQVGIVATAHHARLFLCGGPSSYSSATHWFSIDVSASEQIMAEAGSTGPLSVVGHIGQADAGGVITLADGTALTFQASRTVPGTLAGLYEAAAPCGKAGLIVTQPSLQAPASGQGTCIGAVTGSSADRVLQVTPIAPIARAADGSIHASVAGGEISLVAAAPPAL